MNQQKEYKIWQNTETISALLKDPVKKIVILAHLNPDGDTLGSSLALLNLVEKAGHTGHVVCPNDFPVFLKWLPGSEKIILVKDERKKALEIIREADILFAIDFNELKRVKDLNESVEKSSAYKVLIDHHPNPQIIVNCLLSDTSASSTAELVYRFVHESGLAGYVDKEIASCLFAGIMTDTGCFSYNSSGRSTWLAVADLLNYGIDKDRIYSLIYDNYSVNRMKLLGYSLHENMEILPDLNTGYIYLSREDLVNFKFEVGDSEGFVNYPLFIKGIRFSVLFIEKEDHVKISFRSKGSFPVNEVAKKYFNGGGHRNASGGEFYSNLKEAIKRFMEVLPEYRVKLNENED